MHLKSNTLHKKIFFLLMVSVMILLGIDSQTVYAAGITSDNAFDNAVWELVLEDPVHAPTGVVQAVCATDKYIVCLENTSDHTDEADTLTAYYKTDLDENGKKVEPYSVAKTVKERNYEHANGLAYNPKTNEILISGYTNSIPETAAACSSSTLILWNIKPRYKSLPIITFLGLDIIQIPINMLSRQMIWAITITSCSTLISRS